MASWRLEIAHAVSPGADSQHTRTSIHWCIRHYQWLDVTFKVRFCRQAGRILLCPWNADVALGPRRQVFGRNFVRTNPVVASGTTMFKYRRCPMDVVSPFPAEELYIEIRL